jgi:hypothetical protein
MPPVIQCVIGWLDVRVLSHWASATFVGLGWRFHWAVWTTGYWICKCSVILYELGRSFPATAGNFKQIPLLSCHYHAGSIQCVPAATKPDGSHRSFPSMDSKIAQGSCHGCVRLVVIRDMLCATQCGGTLGITSLYEVSNCHHSKLPAVITSLVVNTLGTGYLNCLYAYKRKSTSPVLNVLTCRKSYKVCRNVYNVPPYCLDMLNFNHSLTNYKC